VSNSTVVVRTVKTVRTTRTVRTVKTVRRPANERLVEEQDSRVIRNPETGRIRAIVVRMADGSVRAVRQLLGEGDNPKLLKSDKASRFVTAGLSLAPAMTSGFQTCASASEGCKKACIYTAGMGGLYPNIPAARIAKTRAFFLERAAFLEMLTGEIRRADRRARRRGRKLAVRLNVFSDVMWERVAPELFSTFPHVQFYDYTKHAQRALRHASGDAFPRNYHLTFSRSEVNDADALAVLRAGGNVSVVFAVTPSAWKAGERPQTFAGFPVIDGDVTDLRFADPHGVVVGLFAKGKGRTDASGFVVRPEQAGRVALATI
jgi:hypothetical protein